MHLSQSRRGKSTWILAVACGLTMGLGTLSEGVEAQTTTRVDGAIGPSIERFLGFSLSGNGRWIAFESFVGLVPEDTNGNWDVYLRDLNTGETQLVSVDLNGKAGNFESMNPSISADGRWVAFASLADNLVGGDTNEVTDVFVYDRQAMTTTRISMAPGGGQFTTDSISPSISADGQWVAFGSSGFDNIYLFDRQTGTTALVTVPSGGGIPNGASFAPDISGNGQFIAYVSSSSNLVRGDTNNSNDAFVYDRQTGQTTRVNMAINGGEGGSVGVALSISADGRHIAFMSDASNFVGNDTNGESDIFVFDRQTGETTRISVRSDGGEANDISLLPSLNADGRYVGFVSAASNLVPDDTNGIPDIFVHDRQTGETTRVSIATGGGQANGDNWAPSISGDGQRVAFLSFADNLGSGGPEMGDVTVYVHDSDGLPPTNRAGNTDLDGNGTSDLLWRNSKTGSTAIWLLNGTGIGAAGFPGGVSLAWQIAGIGDVNGDGKADVIWRHTTSATVAIWLMNGVTITSVGFPASVPTAWSLQAVGDVNGDGKADLVWRNSNDGNTAIWLMNGTRIATSGFLGKVPLAWQLAGVGDVNGDSKADFIWRNGTSHAVAIWVINGLTMTSSGFPGNVSPDVQIAGVGDVNGDGKADLVWRNTNTGDVDVWLLNGTTIGSTGSLDGLSSQWQIAQVGDADGDGKADVIWYDTTSGAVVCWLLNGLTIASEAFPGTASPDWIIAGRPVPPPLSITTASTLSAGTVGQIYNVSIGVTGGTTPFTWNVFSGSLPPGLTLNPSTGKIDGTPTAAGNFLFTIRVRDRGNPALSAQELFSLTINSPPSPPPTGGGRGTLTITGAPAAVGGTFIVNSELTSTSKETQLLLGQVIWGEAGNLSNFHYEALIINFNYNTGELAAPLGVSFAISDAMGATGWVCGGSFVGLGLPTFPSSCNGVTVNPSGGTATFSNTVLEISTTSGPPITLNGTLTFPPF